MAGPKFENGKVQCEVCKKWFFKLSNHLQTHGMKADDYRGQFGYSIGTDLDVVKNKNPSYSKVYENTKDRKIRRAYQIQKEVDIFDIED